MRKQLTELRRKMAEKDINAYIIPTTDFHGSEYVHEYFKCREYVSGFTGSAGTLAVTEYAAALWTDGRYFLQAAEQLEGSGIELMREGEPDTPELTEWLKMQRAEAFMRAAKSNASVESEVKTANADGDSSIEAGLEEWSVGFDGRIVDWQFGKRLEESFEVCGSIDLVGEIWEARPKLCSSEIYALPLSVTGESAASKLSRLRSRMKAVGADCHLITSLEETAWLFNLRASDILHTPVFYAFTLIMPDCVRVYLLNTSERVKSLFNDSVSAVSPESAGDIPEQAEKSVNVYTHERVEIRHYFEIFDDLKKLGGASVLFDEKTTSYALAKVICENDGVKQILREDPAMLMKAIKNETEISCTRQAHIRDGAAVTEFIYRLKKELELCKKDSLDEKAQLRQYSDMHIQSKRKCVTSKESITELRAAEMLWEERKKQGAYDTSFDTISAYGEHGAIVHYAPTKESDAVLKKEGFLLVDSGGQYYDGTTDITRTIALGELTHEMKYCYTMVLKSHIALATAVFDENTSGADLDRIARKPLKAEGMDYKHGTGHGVGHMLGVHEGPNTISPRGCGSHILSGMITSNEPGIYFEGGFGIRLENEILCVEAAKASKSCEPSESPKISETAEIEKEEGIGTHKLAFETISFCPFEREAILEEMLTEKEKAWLNSYHAEVYEKISPLLSAHLRRELKKQTAEIK